MPSLAKCRETVDRLIDEGASMPEDENAALWLYAHALGCHRRPRDRSLVPQPRRRRVYDA